MITYEEWLEETDREDNEETFYVYLTLCRGYIRSKRYITERNE